MQILQTRYYQRNSMTSQTGAYSYHCVSVAIYWNGNGSLRSGLKINDSSHTLISYRYISLAFTIY